MGDEKQFSWAAFQQANANREPRPLFTRAMGIMDAAGAYPQGGAALDLGSGDGTEALHLVQRGWHVTAVDREVALLRSARAVLPEADQHRLMIREESFTAAELPSADLIYAGYSLPFCPPEKFDAMWGRILGAIRPGGWLVAHIFGDRDTWADSPMMTFHTEAQITERLAAMSVESMVIEDQDGDSFSGPKHWHVFEVVARKPA